jgi:molecular chaperone HtpG
MDERELEDNLGTIARSGTRKFLDGLSADAKKDSNLIGQFGVGFYSSFIVADKVTVLTRHAGEKPEQGVRWESDGGGEYTVEMIDRPGRGTEITLHLREGQEDLADGTRLRSIIRLFGPPCAVMRDLGRAMIPAANALVSELGHEIPSCHAISTSRATSGRTS